MEWAVSEVGGALVGRTSGTIDEKNWQAFQPLISDGVRQAAAAGKNFTLDMAAIDHMSSRGLRTLTVAREEAKALGVTIRLANPRETMREILDITSFDEIFEVIDTPGSAA